MKGIFLLQDIREDQLLNNITATMYSTILVKGWFGGGDNGLGSIYSTIERIDFSNDTVVDLIRGNLSSNKYTVCGISNGVNGWFAGGYTGSSNLPNVDRMTFATDTANTVARSALLTSRMGAGGSGNATNGWISGGYNAGTYLSSTERIIYASDTVSPIYKGNLTLARHNLSSS